MGLVQFVSRGVRGVKILQGYLVFSERFIIPGFALQDLDLPWITGEVLRRLDKQLHSPEGLVAGAPVTFQYMEGKTWYDETL